MRFDVRDGERKYRDKGDEDVTDDSNLIAASCIVTLGRTLEERDRRARASKVCRSAAVVPTVKCESRRVTTAALGVDFLRAAVL